MHTTTCKYCHISLKYCLHHWDDNSSAFLAIQHEKKISSGEKAIRYTPQTQYNGNDETSNR